MRLENIFFKVSFLGCMVVNFDKEKLYASLLLSSEVVQYLVTVQKSEFKEEIGLGVSCACGVLRIATFVGFFPKDIFLGPV